MNSLKYPTALLFLLGIVTRLPFASRILHHWDSVNFALALEVFDVRLHQPHPPGTFVIYVFAGRLLNIFLGDGNASLVLVSILATAGASALLFRLVAAWSNRRQAWITALLMLTSPLIWFQGEVALSYMAEFFCVVLFVYTCARNDAPSRAALFASALLLGLAGGIRPNTPVFLLPLWLFVVVRGMRAGRYSTKDVLLSAALVGVGVLVWAVPMVNLSGGVSAYLQMIEWWREQHTEASGSASGILGHVVRLAIFLAYAVGAALLPALWLIFKDWRELKGKFWRDWRVQTLAIWIAPGLAYYILIHVQQSGHTFTIMPAVIIIAGFVVVRLGDYLSRYNRYAMVAVAGAVIACNTLFFLLGPADLFGESRVTLTPPTRAAIREYDRYIADRLQVIGEHFPPDGTVLLTDSRNFRIPDYYLRDYLRITPAMDLKDQFVTLPEGAHTLVLFDDLPLRASPGITFQALPLPGGGVSYLTWGANQQVRLNRSTLVIETKTAQGK